MARPKGSKDRKLSQQQEAAIVRGVKRGDSYYKWATKYNVSSSRIMDICRRSGVVSEFAVPYNFDKKVRGKGRLWRWFYGWGWLSIIFLLVAAAIGVLLW